MRMQIWASFPSIGNLRPPQLCRGNTAIVASSTSHPLLHCELQSFPQPKPSLLDAHAAPKLAIPVLKAAPRFCDQFPCGAVLPLPTIASSFLLSLGDISDAVRTSAATSDAIGVLIADSNRMQAQLLTSALRRHPEFHVTTCPMDTASILQAVASKPPRVALLSLNPPAIRLRNRDDPAPLSSFPSRDSQSSSGRLLRPRTRGQRLPLRRPRHLLHHRGQSPPAVPVPAPRGRRTDLGQHRATQLPHGPHL